MCSRLDPDESIGLGLGMAVCGNLITTVGLNVQRYAHTKATPGTPYTESKLWWVGVGLMILGEVGNFGAYGKLRVHTLFRSHSGARGDGFSPKLPRGTRRGPLT